ncbi:MAG: RIP metalloprotease RseP [Bacteroidetes bacterium]|nr:RIP metalloprotease RseP [Bacteroidota bacterium]
MVALIKAAQLLLSLSILVVLHELGHYWAARAFKTRVEKFYLFMNPGFSLFKKQIGETEWGIGWLPLGGYVKISGMIDESMDTEQMAQPPQPWEFRSKPAWQRLIIMLGGIIVNLILGFIIYSGVLYVWGETKLANEYPVNVDPKLEELGFQDGDRILGYNGETLRYYSDLRMEGFNNRVTQVDLLRDGRMVSLELDKELGQTFIDEGIRRPFSLLYPCEIAEVDSAGRASLAGLQVGDRILSVGDMTLPYFETVREAIQAHPETPVRLTVERGGQRLQLDAVPDSAGSLGFFVHPAAHYADMFPTLHLEYGLFESFGAGFTTAWETLQDYVRSMRFLFTKSGASQVGSLVTFGSIFDAGWDWEIFWRNTAFFSLILAFMNLLPIPALDGGHVMFTLYEMIAGRPASEKFLERAQMIGIVLLLSLMVFALGNDFWRLFTGGFG